LNDWKWVTLYLDYIDSNKKRGEKEQTKKSKQRRANKEEPKEKRRK